MTDQTLVIIALLCCGLLSAVILLRAASDVFLRSQTSAKDHDET